FTVQKGLPLMVDGGSIIMNGSMASVKGFPAFGVYNASKAAIRSFAAVVDASGNLKVPAPKSSVPRARADRPRPTSARLAVRPIGGKSNGTVLATRSDRPGG